MKQDPEDEEVSDLIAHVAAVAAAYGDPNGKYKAFLQKNRKDYQTQSFWFYDQTDALPNSPAASKHKRDLVNALAEGTNMTMVGAEGLVASVEGGIIPFECPDVFASATQVEIEDGLFVTCDQLAPYYNIPVVSDM